MPVTFPVGSLRETGTGSLFVIPVSFDITATQIIGAYAASSASAPGGFNGYVFDFSGLAAPITGVTVDPLSTFIPRAVTFDAASIQVNGASQSTSGRFVLDITGGGGAFTAVPEPTSLALLGAGVVGVALGARRRRAA